MANSRKEVTVRDIARECGVSATTVSLALRNHPKISEQTRERIQTVAKHMNYTCDPMTSALMSSLSQSRKPASLIPLAAVYAHNEKMATACSYNQRLWAGISRRTKELGFPIDRFFLEDRKISSKRISEILFARGIKGVIVLPASHSGSHLTMDWNSFSAVAIGYSMLRPNIDRVCQDQYQEIRMALKQLYSRGYERPGLFLRRTQDLRSLYSWSSGFYGYEFPNKKNRTIPVLEYDETGDHTNFFRWFKKYRPDVLIGTGYHLLEEAELKCPEDVGLVTLGYDATNPKFAGIDEQVELLGEAAVNHLTQLLYNNRRGVPDVPGTFLIPPKWMNGASLPKRKAVSSQGLEK